MKRIKNQKGITLVALIITIIVLLILAVVAIRAVQGDGIIAHAKNARDEYGRKSEEENGTLQNYADYITGQLGGNGGDSKEEDLLKKYFLGDNLTGRDFSEIAEMTDVGGMPLPTSYKDTDKIKNVEALNWMIYDADSTDNAQVFNLNVYVKYENKAYRVKSELAASEEGIAHKTKSLELVYEPQGIEGQTREYTIDGKKETWTVLYDDSKYGDSNKIVVVSNKNIGTYQLGYQDKASQTPGDLDNNGTANESVDKAIYSYNHAVDTLNNECRIILNNSDLGGKPIRSVGSNPSYKNVNTSNFGADTTTATYSSSNTTNWNTNYNGKGKITDNNAEQDYVRMCYWGIVSSDSNYWLASRFVYASPDSVYFDVRFAYSDFAWAAFGYGLWGVYPSGAVGDYDPEFGLRACAVVDK